MQLIVNGSAQSFPEVTRLTEILQTFGITSETRGVAVALNLEVVPRSEWERTSVKEHDRIEIVHARQGG